jgi:hypothetical protein
MSSILLTEQTDATDPFIHQSRVLPGAEVISAIYAAREHIISQRSAPPFQPGKQASSCIRQQLELDRPISLLLHDDCSGANLPANYQVADLYLNHVAATQLAVDRQVKQRPITQPTMLVKEKADGPNLPRF